MCDLEGLNSGAYKSLRQEVLRLKEEHTQLQGSRTTKKQAMGIWLLFPPCACPLCQIFKVKWKPARCSNLTTVTAMQLERLAVLQKKNELQLQEEQYQLKIAQLQASLQQAHDRCGKIRLQFERYNSHLLSAARQHEGDLCVCCCQIIPSIHFASCFSNHHVLLSSLCAHSDHYVWSKPEQISLPSNLMRSVAALKAVQKLSSSSTLSSSMCLSFRS